LVAPLTHRATVDTLRLWYTVDILFQVDILCLWYCGWEACTPAVLGLASDAAEERGLPRAAWPEDRHRLACQPKSYPEVGYFTVTQNISPQVNCPASQRFMTTVGWKPAPRQVTAEGKQFCRTGKTLPASFRADTRILSMVTSRAETCWCVQVFPGAP